MDIEAVKKERQNWLKWKNIAPLREMLTKLPNGDFSLRLGDVIEIEGELDQKERELVKNMALGLKPWRKGPFRLFDTFIDSEWRSYIKYNLLKPHIDLEGKDVADIGCNNGYYMFRMLEFGPKSITGFDPSPIFKTQFDFIDHFAKSGIEYELLGVEHLPYYPKKFDSIFCLGVLYHRSDPVVMLKALKKGLKKGGEVILDTFYIEGDEPIALCPDESYSKIPNITFIPTVKALEHWCKRAGFGSFEVLAKSLTTTAEQRKTEWIDSQSLEDFLDPDDSLKTIEGYPAPRRVYVRLKEK